MTADNKVTVTMTQKTLTMLVESFVTSWEYLEQEDKDAVLTLIKDHPEHFDRDVLVSMYPFMSDDL